MKTTKFSVLRDKLMADPERARLVAEAQQRLAAELAAYEQSQAESGQDHADADTDAPPRAQDRVRRSAPADRDQDAD